jgi:hypothetical protein
MIEDLPIELVAQQDHILAFAAKQFLFRITGIPDPRLGHEIEPCPVHDGCPFELSVCAKEDRCAKDPLEGCDQPTVLRPALLKSEGIQHLSGAVEDNPRRLLTDRHSREEDRNQTVLAPGQAITGMASDLKDELPVPAFLQEASWSGTLQRETAQDERTGREAEILALGIAVF